ncbi:MAG: PQQ-dependent sugar dehydrogenase [Chthonomonadaceae bacterium]|nr:PQQ-dependent sugar dehydrogenase [Chthonomonadaceae bacterium]
MFRLLVLSFATATTVMCALGPNNPKLTSQTVNVTNLYNDTCSKCHGVNGEGGGAGTKTLLTDDKFDAKYDRPYFEAIKVGVPTMGMSEYGSTMSDETIWSLVVHIRELQAKAWRQSRPRTDASKIVHTDLHDYLMEDVVTEGLKTPWAIDWLPDGKMLVTNRPGTMLLIDKSGKQTQVEGLPKVVELGQGGLMEVAVHPKGKWIYLSIADPKEGNDRQAMTKIVRGQLDGAKWVKEETIFEAGQEFYTGAGVHFGSKITFDKSGHVFFNVGERGGNMLAQKLDNPFGKIYRLNDDGSVPKDNPYVDESPFPGMWSFGHRNPQGLAIDLKGRLWDTEHGPRGGDEVNLIKKGSNYGWPVVAFSINYNDSPFRTPWPKADEDIELPAFRWLPSIGASGLDIYAGDAFPKWKGDLLAGGLSGANLTRIRVADSGETSSEELLFGLGRVRDVRVGPNGYVYVALNQPDKIIRLRPAKS